MSGTGLGVAALVASPVRRSLMMPESAVDRRLARAAVMMKSRIFRTDRCVCATSKRVTADLWVADDDADGTASARVAARQFLAFGVSAMSRARVIIALSQTVVR